jgi:hypothetical protein
MTVHSEMPLRAACVATESVCVLAEVLGWRGKVLFSARWTRCSSETRLHSIITRLPRWIEPVLQDDNGAISAKSRLCLQTDPLHTSARKFSHLLSGLVWCGLVRPCLLAGTFSQSESKTPYPFLFFCHAVRFLRFGMRHGRDHGEVDSNEGMLLHRYFA